MGAFLISSSKLKIPPFGRCTFLRQKQPRMHFGPDVWYIRTSETSDNVSFLLWGVHNRVSTINRVDARRHPALESGYNISIASASYKEAPGNNSGVLSSFKMQGNRFKRKLQARTWGETITSNEREFQKRLRKNKKGTSAKTREDKKGAENKRTSKKGIYRNRDRYVI